MILSNIKQLRFEAGRSPRIKPGDRRQGPSLPRCRYEKGTRVAIDDAHRAWLTSRCSADEHEGAQAQSGFLPVGGSTFSSEQGLTCRRISRTTPLLRSGMTGESLGRALGSEQRHPHRKEPTPRDQRQPAERYSSNQYLVGMGLCDRLPNIG